MIEFHVGFLSTKIRVVMYYLILILFFFVDRNGDCRVEIPSCSRNSHPDSDVNRVFPAGWSGLCTERHHVSSAHDFIASSTLHLLLLVRSYYL